MYSTQQTASWWTWLLDATMIVLGLYLIVKLAVAVLFLGFSRSFGGKEESDEEEHQSENVASPLTISRTLDACDRHSLTLRKGRLFNEERSWGPVRRAWEGFRDLCFVIQDSKWFQYLTIAMIILNAISMAIQWTDMPEAAVLATTYANYAFSMYFGE